MQRNNDLKPEQLSPWWKHTVVLIMAFGFTILIWRSIQTYSDAPPIPVRAVTTNNETVFTRDDMRMIEWFRMPADLIFIGFGVVPLLIAGLRVYKATFSAARREPVSIPVAGIGLKEAR